MQRRRQSCTGMPPFNENLNGNIQIPIDIDELKEQATRKMEMHV